MQGLDVQASYRRDRTRTRTFESSATGIGTLPTPDAPRPDVTYVTGAVSANQYTLGLRYRPMNSIALRVSYGVGVLPPTITQLVPSYLTNFPVSGLTDPRRKHDLVGSVPRYSQLGYAGLQEEESSSWSAGVIFTPSMLDDLRISVDYTQIFKTNEISLITPSELLELEEYYPDRVKRDPLTEEDRLAGYTVGRIQELNSGYVNFAKTMVEAYDVKFDYAWQNPYGTFRAHLLGSFQPHKKIQVQTSSPMVENAGYGASGAKWRGRFGLSWERNEWMAGWNAQYYNSYNMLAVSATESSRNTYIANNGTDIVPRQLFHDLYVRYRAQPHAPGLLAGTELMIGIANVLNTYPSLIVAGFSTSNPASPGDVRLRNYTISLRKGFGGPN